MKNERRASRNERLPEDPRQARRPAQDGAERRAAPRHGPEAGGRFRDCSRTAGKEVQRSHRALLQRPWDGDWMADGKEKSLKLQNFTGWFRLHVTRSTSKGRGRNRAQKKRTRLTRRAQPYRIGHRQITTWQRHVHKHARQHVDKDLLVLGVVVPKGPTGAAAEGRAAWTAALSRAARRARTSVTPWWSRDREPRVPPAGTVGRPSARSRIAMTLFREVYSLSSSETFLCTAGRSPTPRPSHRVRRRERQRQR